MDDLTIYTKDYTLFIYKDVKCLKNMDQIISRIFKKQCKKN